MSNFRSTIASYEYYLSGDTDGGLFSGMDFPEGIDTNTVINTIMLECGEMTPIYTNPYFMRSMISAWSEKWSRTFAKWITAYNATYNPIHNYDRSETINDLRHTNTSSTDDSTVTGTRSAYDASTYQPHDQNTVDSDSTFTDDGWFNRTINASGNIGVTTTQQMLTDEYEIAKWNIYDAIKDIFMQEFCVMIY